VCEGARVCQGVFVRARACDGVCEGACEYVCLRGCVRVCLCK
jgi:hypothetical protein